MNNTGKAHRAAERLRGDPPPPISWGSFGFP